MPDQLVPAAPSSACPSQAGTGGGQLWAYYPKGDVQMDVPRSTRSTGWPKLMSATMAPGFPHDIRHKFFEFDGTVPHAVLPYTGNRLSFVYFTRSKYLATDAHDRNRFLNQIGQAGQGFKFN